MSRSWRFNLPSCLAKPGKFSSSAKYESIFLSLLKASRMARSSVFCCKVGCFPSPPGFLRLLLLLLECFSILSPLRRWADMAISLQKPITYSCRVYWTKYIQPTQLLINKLAHRHSKMIMPEYLTWGFQMKGNSLRCVTDTKAVGTYITNRLKFKN